MKLLRRISNAIPNRLLHPMFTVDKNNARLFQNFFKMNKNSIGIRAVFLGLLTAPLSEWWWVAVGQRPWDEQDNTSYSTSNNPPNDTLDNISDNMPNDRQQLTKDMGALRGEYFDFAVKHRFESLV